MRAFPCRERLIQSVKVRPILSCLPSHPNPESRTATAKDFVRQGSALEVNPNKDPPPPFLQFCQFFLHRGGSELIRIWIAHMNSQLILRPMEITCGSLMCWPACLIQNSPILKDFHLVLLFRIKREAPAHMRCLLASTKNDSWISHFGKWTSKTKPGLSLPLLSHEILRLPCAETWNGTSSFNRNNLQENKAVTFVINSYQRRDNMVSECSLTQCGITYCDIMSFLWRAWNATRIQMNIVFTAAILRWLLQTLPADSAQISQLVGIMLRFKFHISPNLWRKDWWQIWDI